MAPSWVRTTTLPRNIIVLTDDDATAVTAGPSSGDGLYLETGSDFLLLENGDFLLLE